MIEASSSLPNLSSMSSFKLTLAANVDTPATLRSSKSVLPSTSRSPLISTILPALATKPLRAVITPIESTFVTSSYCSTPPTVRLPETVTFLLALL